MFISYPDKPHIRNKVRCDLCEKEYYIIPGKNEPPEDLLISQEFFTSGILGDTFLLLVT